MNIYIYCVWNLYKVCYLVVVMKKGTAMNKILEFFQEELAINNEHKNKLENEIHRAIIDIEFVSKTRQKIASELDNTHDIFVANGAESTFCMREIDSLNKSVVELNELIVKTKMELEKVQGRIDSINEIFLECTKAGLNADSVMSGLDILKIQENDRQRIARDIHDSTVQKLTALIHKSEFTMKVIDTDPGRAKLEMEIINKVARDCIGELRGIIFDLRPMSINDLGLEVTLRHTIAQLNSMTEMTISLSFDSEVNYEINPIISVTILRIIQELCSNSIKYSYGKMIDIEIKIMNDSIHIDFSDDGVGINEDNISSERSDNTGFGIQFLKERVRLLGGSANFGAGENNIGLRYKIEIPCHNEEKQNDN